MVNHISDIRSKKNGPVSRHINNNADRLLVSRAEEYIILYPIEQILDQGKADRNKSLDSKESFIGLKHSTLNFPMEWIIKFWEHVVITFLFSSNAIKAFKITKNVYKML